MTKKGRPDQLLDFHFLSLKNEGHLPKKCYADSGYGSNKNYVESAPNGVELIASAPPKPAGKVGLDECKINEQNLITGCPNGRKPAFKEFKNGKGRAVFFKSVYGYVLDSTSCSSNQ